MISPPKLNLSVREDVMERVEQMIATAVEHTGNNPEMFPIFIDLSIAGGLSRLEKLEVVKRLRDAGWVKVAFRAGTSMLEFTHPEADKVILLTKGAFKSDEDARITSRDILPPWGKSLS